MALVYTAKTVAGVVYVLSADGRTQVLREGDQVVRGDTLIAGVGGWAQLVAAEAPPLHLLAERQIKIDDSLFAESAPTPASAALAGGSVAIVANIVRTVTPNDDLAPAPQEQVTSGGAGGGFVRLLRVMEVTAEVDNKFDKDLLISSINDRDVTLLVLTEDFKAEMTSPTSEPAAPLLLSDVLTGEAEILFADEAPGLDAAEPVESSCIDLNTWTASHIGSVLAHCHLSAGEG